MNVEVDLPPGDRIPPALLLTHGAGGNLSSPGLKALSKGLAECGHLSVRADLPYRSAGRRSPPAAEKSVAGLSAICRAVQSEFTMEITWVVGGRSYGGRVASMAVAGSLPSAGLLLCSYPLHRPGHPESLRTEHWPNIKVPCLFIQGTADPFCDLSLLNDALGRLAAPSRVIVVEGGDHSLRVPRSRSPNGKALSEQEAIESLMPEIAGWLGDL